MATLINGIFQSDILIQAALRMGLKEFRDEPDLIDDVFAGLLDDPLTVDKYGDKTLQQCKDWFAGTSIKVKLGLQVAQGDLPCVAFAIGQSGEGEATLGDTHHESSEVDPTLATSYRNLHSVVANETYTIGIFVHGEPEYALFLYSLVLFAILRRKQDLLEARGFEVSTFQVGPLSYANSDVENVYTRSINLTGKVRHSWPGIKTGRAITQVETNLPTEAVVGTANAVRSSADPADLTALGDLDMLSGVRALP